MYKKKHLFRHQAKPFHCFDLAPAQVNDLTKWETTQVTNVSYAGYQEVTRDFESDRGNRYYVLSFTLTFP